MPLLTESVSIAAVNGPDSVVVSGEAGAVREIASRFERTRELRVSHAFHSPLMDPMLEEFRAVAEGLTYHAPRLAIVSTSPAPRRPRRTALARLLGAPRARRGPLRRRRTRPGGRGRSAVRRDRPGGVLTAMAAESLRGDAAVVPLLRKDREEPVAVVTALGALHAHGVSVDWSRLLPEGTGVDLPTYAFQRSRYWTVSDSTFGRAAADHPLFGTAVELAGIGGTLYTGTLSLADHPWLADHAVGGVVLLPGTAYVEMALAAGARVDCGLVEELTIAEPLVLPEDGSVRVQCTVGEPDDSGARAFRIHSARAEGDRWTAHAIGVLREAPEETPFEAVAWPPPGAEPLEVSDTYERLADLGAQYGPAFQGCAPRGAWATRCSPRWRPRRRVARRRVHPALFDSALHGIGLRGGVREAMALPFAWSGVELYAAGRPPCGCGSARRDRRGTDRGHRRHRHPVLRVASLSLREVSMERLASAAASGSDALFALEWTGTTSALTPSAGRWAVFGDAPRELADALAGEAAEVTVVADLDEAAATVGADSGSGDAVVLCHVGGADAEAVRGSARNCWHGCAPGWPTSGSRRRPWSCSPTAPSRSTARTSPTSAAPPPGA
ncbi:polyketide synthase dehydratase domain-containing protein [Streptomyces sp. M19]